MAEGSRPDADSEHVVDLTTLHPAQQHDDPDDAERVERQLLAEHAHADLQRSFCRLKAADDQKPSIVNVHQYCMQCPTSSACIIL